MDIRIALLTGLDDGIPGVFPRRVHPQAEILQRLHLRQVQEENLLPGRRRQRGDGNGTKGLLIPMGHQNLDSRLPFAHARLHRETFDGEMVVFHAGRVPDQLGGIVDGTPTLAQPPGAKDMLAGAVHEKQPGDAISVQGELGRVKGVPGKAWPGPGQGHGPRRRLFGKNAHQVGIGVLVYGQCPSLRPGQDRLEGAALQADDSRRFGVDQLVQPPRSVVRLLVDVVPSQMETLLPVQEKAGRKKAVATDDAPRRQTAVMDAAQLDRRLAIRYRLGPGEPDASVRCPRNVPDPGVLVRQDQRSGRSWSRGFCQSRSVPPAPGKSTTAYPVSPVTVLQTRWMRSWRSRVIPALMRKPRSSKGGSRGYADPKSRNDSGDEPWDIRREKPLPGPGPCRGDKRT